MNPFEGLSARELELLRRKIAKANPPPVVYRYRRDSEWTIKELTVPEVHVAGVSDMNDPFEYRAPLAIDLEKLKIRFFHHCLQQGMDQHAAKREVNAVNQHSLAHLVTRLEDLRKFSGLICCSGNPRSNRMWAYYANGHKGICVGYGADHAPFCFAQKVNYRDPDGSLDLMDILAQDPTLLSDHVSCRKGAEWEFEEEFRISIGPIPDAHTRLLPIPPAAIVEIRLGANISPDFKNKVLEAIRVVPNRPRVIQMGCDHSNFKLTEQVTPTT